MLIINRNNYFNMKYKDLTVSFMSKVRTVIITLYDSQ